MDASQVHRQKPRNDIINGEGGNRTGTHWVDASQAPSALKHMAMVERAGGSNEQYVARQCCRKSSSVQFAIAAAALATAGMPRASAGRRACGAVSRSRRRLKMPGFFTLNTQKHGPHLVTGPEHPQT